jgi:DNA-binding GntR family transcriptional regulator
VSAVPDHPDALECPRGLRRHTIVQSLLADIFQARIRAGEHLVTEDLARRFGVSHTPIREAFMTLAGMGVLDLLPNRGATVRRVTAKEVREICQVRRALECEAARRACGRIGADDLRQLEADLRRLLSARPGPRSVADARAIDNRLHDLIAESCGNAFLAKELSRLKTLFRAFRDFAWEHAAAHFRTHRIGEEVQEHLAIVTALATNDPKAAARAMARHIRSGALYWGRMMPAAVGSGQQKTEPQLRPRKRTYPR